MMGAHFLTGRVGFGLVTVLENSRENGFLTRKLGRSLTKYFSELFLNRVLFSIFLKTIEDYV